MVHCFFVESLIFRNIKKLHVYSNYDKQIMQKYFLIRNSISISNFKLDKNENNNVSKFENNQDKIFIVGDLNQEEIFQGLKNLLILNILINLLIDIILLLKKLLNHNSIKNKKNDQ